MIYKTNRKYVMNRQLEEDYRNYLVSLLREIYRKGIIDMSSAGRKRKGKI